MPMPEQRGDWDWLKNGDTWCRRPIDTAEPWQTLTTTLVGRPPDNSRCKGPDNQQLPSLYRWDWKEAK